MYPKSNAKLKLGDFCWIRRDDGSYVPFIFIQKMDRARSYFHGAVLNTRVNEMSTDQLKSDLEVLSHAQLHIECFAKNETPIVGNILDKLSESSLDETDQVINHSPKSYVWGYRTIYKHANQVA